MVFEEPMYIRTRLGIKGSSPLGTKKSHPPGIETVWSPEIQIVNTWNPNTFLYLIYNVASPAWRGRPAEEQHPVLIVARGSIGTSNHKATRDKIRLVNKSMKNVHRSDM